MVSVGKFSKYLGGKTIERLFSRVFESPLMLIGLMASTLGMGTVWTRAQAAHRAPAVPGYNWSRHPKALLVVVPAGDCGCGIAPMSVIREALERNIAVVVAATAPNDNTKQLRNMSRGNQRPFMAENVSRDFLLRFAPKDKVGFVCIQDGRIISEAQGKSSTLFLDKLQQEKT